LDSKDSPGRNGNHVGGHWILDHNPTRYQDGPSEQAAFWNPQGLCVGADGTVYVADTSNHVIRKIVQLDWDDDGIADAREGGTNPCIVGVDDRRVDSDGDGLSNAAEYLAGTDGLDATSSLRLEFKLTGTGDAAFGWPTVAGRVYQAQRSSDLLNWRNEGGEIIGSGGVIWFTSAWSQSGGRNFYRVSVRASE
jgi:hypothetical protein